ADSHGAVKLGSIARGLRFVFATLVGAVSIGVLAGATVWLTGGHFGTTLWSITASHASAVLITVPLLLVPMAAFRIQLSLELVLQALVLVGVGAFVFWQEQSYPYAFLVIPVLVWAGFRF